MSRAKSIDVAKITAFDVHVHIEHEGSDTGIEQAAKKYLGAAEPSAITQLLRTITGRATWLASYFR